jgi:MFS family permease
MADLAEDRTAEIRRRAMTTVVAFGVVSLLADIVYEGARGIIGPYLLTLGASAAVVGLVSGVGEFVGYALRTVTGILADRTRGYWPLTFIGYGLTVAAVPLLGWVGRADVALVLVVAERLGKAIRSPARDTLLADAAEPLGRGWGFGIHEALDQTGAVAGPLLLAAVLALSQDDYRLAFTILAVPGVLAMIALVLAKRMMPPHEEHVARADSDGSTEGGTDGRARTYLWFVFLSALGFAPFPLIAFHVSSQTVVTDPQIPLMFALAMAVDAGAALISGRYYDRRGLRVLIFMPMMTCLTVFAFSGTGWVVWVAMAVWGAVMGIQESTLRAAVGDLSTSSRRATAYGVFNTAYGIALLFAGLLLGLLYERSITAMVLIILTTQVGAALVLRSLIRHQPSIGAPL